MDERRPPRGPREAVGWIRDDGMGPPVDPGTMKGPRKLDAAGADGSGVATGAELAGMMTSGISPVEPTLWPDETGAAGVGVG